MPQKYIIKIFSAAVLLVVLIPLFARAQVLPVEGNYPSVPGIEVTITRASNLGDIVKYLTSWALILASLVALLSLVGAGLLYLTSAGDPGRMQMGRGRIINSALGLLILLSSYIIFKTIDPKIIIPEVKTVLVASGIFLLADTPGTGDFDKLKSGAIDLSQMVKLQEARFLENDNKDLTKDLGKLEAANFGKTNNAWQIESGKTNKLINYQKFPVRGIAFWGDYGQMMKVVTYSQEDYKEQGSCPPVAFNYQDGAPVPGQKDLYIVDFKDSAEAGSDKLAAKTSFCSLPIGDLKFVYQEMPANKEAEQTGKDGNIYSAPLSIRMNGNGPGVYLYSLKKEKDANGVEQEVLGQEKYFFTAKADFKDSDVAFNDMAQKILLKNRASITDPPDLHDYLVTLHEDPNFEGQFRVYFESSLNRATWYVDQQDGKNKFAKMIGLFNLPPYFWNPNDPLDVAKPIRLNDILDLSTKVPKESFNYGRVNEPSSLQIFELSPDEKVCVKVKLCTEPNFSGNCLVYNSEGKNFGGESYMVKQEVDDKFGLPFGLPRYEPINLPEKASGMLNNKPSDNIKIADNIRSISIDGDCVVALFENSITDWDKKGPGGHSEVFIQSDSDLSDNRIGRCGIYDRIGFKQGAPCARAIAIYPIKAIR